MTSSHHLLQQLYHQHLSTLLLEVDTTLNENLPGEDWPVVALDEPGGFAQLRQQRHDFRGQQGESAFSWSSQRQLWEKGHLFPADVLMNMSPTQQKDLSMSLLLDAALESMDSPVRVALVSRSMPTPHTRPLIRRLFRHLTPDERQEAFHLRLHKIQKEELPEEALGLNLELWAEHPMGLMTSETLQQLLEKCYPSEAKLRALLQCAGHNRHNQRLLADWLEETHFDGCSPRLQQAMMDYCVIQSNPRTWGLLQKWKEGMEEGSHREVWVREYLNLSVQACRRRLSRASGDTLSPASGSPGLTLAQFMFYGDLLRPGKANSGGIATLLRTLGDALAAQPGIKEVFTFMTMPCDERSGYSPLTTPLSPGHTLVRVPVFFDETCSPELFQEKEYDIGHSLDRILELLQINPDVFHVRYSDSASLSAAGLAQRRGKKAVFTLTPDPHRNLRVFRSSTGREIYPADPDKGAEGGKILAQLNKVRAADDILRLCSGVLGIGSEEGKEPLMAFFPQLDEEILSGRIRFQMIPEGIRLIQDTSTENQRSEGEGDAQEEAEKPLLDLLYEPVGQYRLAPHRKHLPVIMTVGRLDPVKGQMNLLEAWSDARLCQTFNLVLVGGDLEHPDEREAAMLQERDGFMTSHPHLMGGFCHLGHMDNHRLRRLQQDLVEAAPGGLPPLYLAPSLKEEFGLSIIEAMAAGMLAAGPKAGGVGSYVEHGRNGFLLETSSTTLLREELLELLINPHPNPREWQTIAQRGKATVESRFDIGQVAAEFAAFYQGVQGEGEKGVEGNE